MPPPQSAAERAEPIALAFALATPLPLLALAPDGLDALGTALLFALPVLALWGLSRLLRRGAPRPTRQPLGPPPIGPVPPEAWGVPFAVRRDGQPLLAGRWDEVVAAARAGRLRPTDEVNGGGEAWVVPAELAELVPFVPSPAEARVRRAYLGALAASLAAGALGVVVLAWARLTGREVPADSALAVLVFAVALLMLLPLRRGWRRLADGRAQGLVPEPPPRRTLGSAPLDAALFGPTPATRVVLAIVVAVSALALVLPEDDLLLRLAKDDAAIRAGEWWRLLTAGLVHGGAVHLAMNGWVLWSLGGFVERLLGRWRMLLVLWGGVLTGSLASFAMNRGVSVGISGGLFALVGALLVLGLRHRRTLPPPLRRMLVRAPVEIIVLNLGLGFAVKFIDNAAHLGGLAGGLALGLMMGLRPEVRAALGAAAGRSFGERPGPGA
jgi:membrane associated rhomboid family serine protease